MNNTYSTKILWSQIDPNLHVRHSAYADIAASARLELLREGAVSLEALQRDYFGPILFKEELEYRKEIRDTQVVTVKSFLKRIERNFSKWSMISEIYREDGELACIVTVHGAWIDLKARKIASLPEQYRASFLKTPQTPDFELID
jgi:acyl-CoA thioester hydrolase